MLSFTPTRCQGPQKQGVCLQLQPEQYRHATGCCGCPSTAAVIPIDHGVSSFETMEGQHPMKSARGEVMKCLLGYCTLQMWWDVDIGGPGRAISWTPAVQSLPGTEALLSPLVPPGNSHSLNLAPAAAASCLWWIFPSVPVGRTASVS